MRQRNIRNRQKNGVDEQRAEANIFNRNHHNEIHSFQQKNKVGTAYTAYAGKTEAFPCSDVILHPKGRLVNKKRTFGGIVVRSIAF